MPDRILPVGSDTVGTLVFFLLVFGVVGVVFLFIHLLMGSVIRPNKPDAEKLTIYECGEPTVGSAWIQFDLRFYVVALLFVIFDVEVAFFFPWATVFGKANQLANMPPIPAVAAGKLSESEKAIEAERARLSAQLLPSGISQKTKQSAKLTDVDGAVIPIKPEAAATWAKIAYVDILVFFGVLLVGFAYLWRRGDIDWVRAYAAHKEPATEPEKPLEQKVVA